MKIVAADQISALMFDNKVDAFDCFDFGDCSDVDISSSLNLSLRGIDKQLLLQVIIMALEEKE